ncbi:HDOD domain-containing protein [Chitinilyticum litopenaei]|uniref:HDOD domain-containing protein n=1 Tax=Chitinilyticum litopenaei TaxID=1121276 RepID=UPI00048F2196|nr:HDOD domain-containing protein [Chitinilyticum litopenaei]
MPAPHTAPKTAEALREERFHLLEDIARELAGDVVFPVCFDATIRISSVMRSQTASLQRIAQEVQKDPLITTKLLKLANTTAFNPGGRPVLDLGSAVLRLGMQTTRSVAMACSLQQLSKGEGAAAFEDKAQALWRHSMRTAAYAMVLARRLTRHNPDVAMLAGLVHDLGAFFLLDRAGHYPELVERPASVDYLVAQWHDSIGATLMSTLGMPEEVIDAVHEIDLPRPPVEQLRTLNDLLYVANLFAGGVEEMRRMDVPMLEDPAELSDPQYLDCQDEAEANCAEMLNVW